MFMLFDMDIYMYCTCLACGCTFTSATASWFDILLERIWDSFWRHIVYIVIEEGFFALNGFELCMYLQGPSISDGEFEVGFGPLTEL